MINHHEKTSIWGNTFTLPETNSSPLKSYHPKRKIVCRQSLGFVCGSTKEIPQVTRVFMGVFWGLPEKCKDSINVWSNLPTFTIKINLKCTLSVWVCWAVSLYSDVYSGRLRIIRLVSVGDTFYFERSLLLLGRGTTQGNVSICFTEWEM